MDSWFRKMSIFTFQVKAEDAKERKEDREKEARTVFVGNLPVSCKKQELKKIFGEYGKIEAVRFRCAARPDLKTTKKVWIICTFFIGLMVEVLLTPTWYLYFDSQSINSSISPKL